jgi:riboflavin transporter
LKDTRLRKMTLIGIFTAMSNILYFIHVPLPIFPSFLSLDLSDIPALVIGIIYGPLMGIMVEFLKNVISYLLQGSYVGLPMGQIANFCSGAIMIGLVSLLYRKWNKPSILSFIPTIFLFLASMFILNLYLLLPAIVKLLGMNMGDYINWIKATNPYVTSLESVVLLVITPFNLIKVLLVYSCGIPLALKLKMILNKKPIPFPEERKVT